VRWKHLVRRLIFLVSLAAVPGLAAAQTVDEINRMGRRTAELYEAGRYEEAIPIAQRLLRALESREGSASINTATALNSLALLLEDANRLPQAEVHYRRVIAILDKAGGPKQPNYAPALGNLSALLYKMNRFTEAETLVRRALTIEERKYGPKHHNVAIRLNNLALILQSTFRAAEAEPIMRRALAIDEASLGPEHPTIAKSLGNLAQILEDLLRIEEAEPLTRRALAIEEKKLGPRHSRVALRLNQIAFQVGITGRKSEAIHLMRRALEIEERNRGPNHPSVAHMLANLGLLLQHSDSAQAEAVMTRALAIEESSFGKQHQRTQLYLSNLAWFHARRGQWSAALPYFRRSNSIVEAIGQRSASSSGDVAKQIISESRHDFRLHVLALSQIDPSGQFSDEAFHMAQRALSNSTGDTLAQMAARFASGKDELAVAARELQDLLRERKAQDGLLLASFAKTDTNSTERVRAVVARSDDRLKALTKRMSDRFPAYLALARPQPLEVRDLQALLRADEALIQFLIIPTFGDIPEAAFAWAITSSEARWVRIDAGAKTISEHVDALRCGLDTAAWRDEGGDLCRRLLSSEMSVKDATPGDTLPFDTGRAYDLYRALFGQLGDLIEHRQLLIVPSGVLGRLPFQVLVTEPPGPASAAPHRYTLAKWLVHRHAVTVLPSVASLAALRQAAKPSAATRAFVGFGNPLLVGPDGKDQSASAFEQCEQASAPPIQSTARTVRAPASQFYKSGVANIKYLKAQYPLPETAYELCTVSRSLGEADDAVYLGGRATETAVKALSESGALRGAKIIHFATHGLLASESELFGGTTEPALLLTPPDTASETDDGLLTGSEVARLKLDADWVVLSACNTAAGGGGNERLDMLSGLARSFIYAGARALMVSHWAVNSDVTVKLVTGTFGHLRSDPRVGRAGALRLAMLEMLKSGAPGAHPANWAPFIVVGEGAALSR
jgi:CHAT domain-containing protein/tetratricopeptide (TPR) repeat protein